MPAQISTCKLWYSVQWALELQFINLIHKHMCKVWGVLCTPLLLKPVLQAHSTCTPAGWGPVPVLLFVGERYRETKTTYQLSFLSLLNTELFREELINMATCTAVQFFHQSVCIPFAFKSCLKAVIQQNKTLVLFRTPTLAHLQNWKLLSTSGS